jgi:hypothetical protein
MDGNHNGKTIIFHYAPDIVRTIEIFNEQKKWKKSSFKYSIKTCLETTNRVSVEYSE